TPQQETPQQETPQQETPQQETPQQETPKQETPKQETPKQETPKQEAAASPDEKPQDKPAPTPIDNLLPPGAAAASPSKAGVESLLPPGAAAGATPAEEVALPKAASTLDETFEAPPEDQTEVAFALREPVKTVGYGDDEVELRQLTSEEKAARGLRRKIIMWTVGLFVIIITMWVLLWNGPLTL
ncbi:MAG: hypothetical protein CL681_15585, partial [Blastopirellula sp.]|nr:hypothetical protein [Blastopirellula sp.]